MTEPAPIPSPAPLERRSLSQRLVLAMLPIAMVGIVGIVLTIVGGLVRPDQFFRSWLFAWIFWLGVSLGSMGVVMLHHLVGGGWGYLIRRFGEIAMMCIPLLAILFIPIILGVRHLYPWAVPDLVAHDPVLKHKVEHWLTWPFWTLRSVIILIAFTLMALSLQTRSLERQGVNAEPVLARLRRVSAGGMVFYFILMSIGAIDWIMSREAHWYSTVFGFIVCISQAVSGACFLIMMLWAFHDEEPLKRIMHPNYLNDLGNVLLTFVILWAYLSFAQFLVIWVGNIQDEITWYIQRTDGGWRFVAAALIAFHFLVPFIILLMRPMKRKMGRLACVAAGLFFMHAIDELYWVTPADPQGQAWGFGRWIFAEGMNLCAFVGIGGVWLAAFLWLLDSRPLLPVGDRVPVLPVDYAQGQRRAPGAVE